MITYLIVPAVTDLAGRCRIVSRRHDKDLHYGLADYRNKPEQWAEAGAMTSRGKLVHFAGTPEQFNDVKSCEPLAAGLTFTYPD